jgi:hypothetical protein
MRFPDSPQGASFSQNVAIEIIAIEKCAKNNLWQTRFFIATELDQQSRVLHRERC